MREMVAHARDLNHPFEEVTLTTEDSVKLHGWFFPTVGQEEHPPLALLLLHGNAGNISTRMDYYQVFLEMIRK